MKRILSLDGGGIRGAATIQFLMLLEEELGKPLYEVFDMIAGTSTGGFIGTAIGNNRMKTEDVSGIYTQENAEIMMDKSLWDSLVGLAQTSPKYEGKGKTDVAKKFLGDAMFSSNAPIVLVTAYDVQARKAVVFNSLEDKELWAWEVADATSAAPCYFPTVQLSDKRWMCDGGVVTNDPSWPEKVLP